MPRTDLNVPFHEKDEAKKLGARWDNAKKVWYVPDGIDVDPFQKWLPAELYPNIHAAAYFIAESQRACWKCSRSSRVFAFLICDGLIFHNREGYAAWLKSPETSQWNKDDTQIAIYYITHLAKTAQAQIKSLTRHYYPDFSQTIGSSYWMNHCEWCEAKQGDFELFEEFDTPFFPVDARNASRILLHPCHEIFEASAEWRAYEPGFFERMAPRNARPSGTHTDIAQRTDRYKGPGGNMNQTNIRKVVEAVLSLIYQDEGLSTPVYLPHIHSLQDIDDSAESLPLIYIWNENRKTGEFVVSINGSIIGDLVEEICNREESLFIQIRDETMAVLTTVTQGAILDMCKKTGCLPSDLF